MCHTDRFIASTESFVRAISCLKYEQSLKKQKYINVLECIEKVLNIRQLWRSTEALVGLKAHQSSERDFFEQHMMANIVGFTIVFEQIFAFSMRFRWCLWFSGQARDCPVRGFMRRSDRWMERELFGPNTVARYPP